MKKILIANAFSINMLSGMSDIRVQPLHLDEVIEAVNEYEVESCVGHAETAAVFTTILGVEVPVIRSTVTLDHDTALIVGQYKGPRLAEGAKSLPEGATIEWWFVTHR